MTNSHILKLIVALAYSTVVFGAEALSAVGRSAEEAHYVLSTWTSPIYVIFTIVAFYLWVMFFRSLPAKQSYLYAFMVTLFGYALTPFVLTLSRFIGI